MKFRMTVLSAGLALFGGVACSSNPASPVSPSATSVAPNDLSADARRSTEPSIVDIAVANNFTILVSAVQKAGLVETLNGSRQFTVFAPTNEAFNAAGQALSGALNLEDVNANGFGDELVAALDVPALTNVLLYHVTNGSRNSTSVLASGKLQMVNGQQATVSGGAIAGAPIVATDIRARNGLVHVIGAVMLPPAN